MPFLSVIVPIYNAEKYLKECLDSVMNQTFKDFEVILVNDGSTDRSPQICDSYAKQYDNVHIVNKENGGLVSARKAGLAKASGEYIGWVDSDDSIVPDMFEKMCGEANKTDADIVICDMWSWSGDKLTPMEQAVKTGGLYTGERLKQDFYSIMLYSGRFYSFGILPAQFNKIIRAPIIRENLEKVDDNITIGEDAACTYFCMLDARAISYLKGEFLYKYRANLSSMCFQWKEEKITSASIILNFMYHRLKEYKNSQMIKQFWYYLVNIYTGVYLEYGAYAAASHMRIELLPEEIALDCDLKKDVIRQVKKKKLCLPYDRMLVIQSVLCGKSRKKKLTQMVLKLRCYAMFLYRHYKG